MEHDVQKTKQDDRLAYQVLEALVACAKTEVAEGQEGGSRECEQEMSERKKLLAAEADRYGIPWALQNQTYYLAQTYPQEYSAAIIERALSACGMTMGVSGLECETGIDTAG